VNFVYDIVHALQNTIDSCINFATDSRSYVLEHMFTKFSEITQCNGQLRRSGSFKVESGVPHFNAVVGVIPCQYRHK